MSGLHSVTEVTEMTSRTKPAQSARTNLPIVVSEGVYDDPLGGDQQCFVLVDERTVGVMPGVSTVQSLLSDQDAVMGVGNDKSVQVMQVENSKLEMVNMRDKETVEMMHMRDGSTVEVLQMEDGKTVEVVQMDGGKTLEVMHIDSSKHPEVIHVDGSSGIEVLNVNDSLKGPIVTSASSTVFGQRNTKCIFSSEESENVAPVAVKRVITSQGNQDTTSLSLRSLATVNPSIVLSTSKSNILPSQEYPRITSSTTLSSRRDSQVIRTHELQTITHVNSNIVLSGSKEVFSGNVDDLNNTIIISWPTIPTEPENTVATQTEPCHDIGPSMNLFFCTFYQDGSVQTQCDMPVQQHVGVSTVISSSCRGQTNRAAGSMSRDDGGTALKMENLRGCESESGDPQYSRSGRVLKRKEAALKAEPGDDEVGDPNFELLGDEEEEEDSGRQITGENNVFRKKRGRKKKRRLPSTEDFEDEFTIPANKEDVKDVAVKEEPVEVDDSELALEILRTKGYGLRTKRRPKKLSDMHYIEEKVVKKRIDRNQEFSCQICSQVFPTFTRLQRHAKDEHDSSEFSFPCDLCGVVFTRPQNLERHKDTKHGDGERRFVCEHCGRRFARHDVMTVHISMVHIKKTLQGKKGPVVIGPNTFHCTSCDKFFSKEQKLRDHKQGDLTCSDCSISFECKTSLRVHRYKHHPTACSECGKVCDSKQQMYFHRLSHDPKFVCKFCKKGFIWKSQYTVHLATHTGEKPVVCDLCGKAFAHKLAVSKHKWQEHNESNKKFKCQTCGKSFVYKAKLQSHIRSHTGEKPFMCHLCPSSFSQRCNLTAHIKSVHGVYIQSIKSDGTTHTQLVKYKRAKKTAPVEAPPAVVNTVVMPSVEAPVPDQPQVAIQEEMPESFETEAAVYQIVYAYPQEQV